MVGFSATACSQQAGSWCGLLPAHAGRWLLAHACMVSGCCVLSCHSYWQPPVLPHAFPSSRTSGGTQQGNKHNNQQSAGVRQYRQSSSAAWLVAQLHVAKSARYCHPREGNNFIQSRSLCWHPSTVRALAQAGPCAGMPQNRQTQGQRARCFRTLPLATATNRAAQSPGFPQY